MQTSKDLAKLVKAIKAQFPMTSTAARKAIDSAWFLLAGEPVDYRYITLHHYAENRLSIQYDGRILADLKFPEGVLPPLPSQISWDLVDAFDGREPRDRSVIQTIEGKVITAALHAECPNCVSVFVKGTTGAPTEMVMLPFLTEGEELLAYAHEQVGRLARLVYCDQRYTPEQVPFGVDPALPILEMIIPIAATGLVAS